MHHLRVFSLALAVTLFGAVGCGDDGSNGTADAVSDTGDPNKGLQLPYDSTSGGVVARYAPDEAGFTATPWPSDRHRGANGRVDMTVMPNPFAVGLIDNYLVYGSATLDGYSRNGGVYFELSGPIDAATLPTDAESMNDPKALAQLVEVTAGSVDYGRRFPLVFAQRDTDGDPYYLGPTLVARPVYGFPLADSGTYCAFLTRGLQDAGGRYLERAPAFADALANAPELAPLRDWLPGSELVADDIAAATCFTTQDATSDMRRIEGFLADYATSPLQNLEYKGTTNHNHEIVATYKAPNFQEGDKPYTGEGGDVKFDGSGDPIVQLDEEIRVRVLLPRNHEMPAAGWPVVLYSHGTGGDWTSCLSAVDKDVFLEGLAMLCIDQPLHGTRGDGTPDYLDSFNFLNPQSGRMSFRQAAADAIYLTRMIADGRFDLTAADSGAPMDIKMDPETIVFFGHSHGGLSGIIVLGVDRRVKGAILSGASGVLAETILRRKDIVDIQALVAAAVQVDQSKLDTFHPIITMAQTLVDATDPINYAPYWLEPVTGGNSKHVFMTVGTQDEASPAVGAYAVAAAAGVPLLEPVVEASRAHELRALAPVRMPVNSNLISTTGQLITAAAQQFDGGDHFVAFTDAGARQIWKGFLRAFRAGDIPVIQP